MSSVRLRAKPVAQCRERSGVALATEDGVDNRESREPGDVADHMMNLEIHLIQCLLHPVHVRRGGLNQALPMAEQRAQAADALSLRCRSAARTHGQLTSGFQSANMPAGLCLQIHAWAMYQFRTGLSTCSACPNTTGASVFPACSQSGL